MENSCYERCRLQLWQAQHTDHLTVPAKSQHLWLFSFKD